MSLGEYVIFDTLLWSTHTSPMSLFKQMPAVLIVDDHRAICSFIAAALENEGYRVCSALNGQKAVELFNSQAIGLLLTDLTMPFQNGIELIRELQVIKPKLPIVAMSGDFQPWRKELDGIPCLDKPFSVETLLFVVKKYWKSTEAHRESCTRDNRSMPKADYRP